MAAPLPPFSSGPRSLHCGRQSIPCEYAAAAPTVQQPKVLLKNDEAPLSFPVDVVDDHARDLRGVDNSEDGRKFAAFDALCGRLHEGFDMLRPFCLRVHVVVIKAAPAKKKGNAQRPISIHEVRRTVLLHL